MSHHKNKINTILTLLDHNPTLTTARLTDIVEELKEALRINDLQPTKRRNILKVLHTMRALDSVLRAFLDHHGLRGDKHSLGDYIKKLHSHNAPHLQKLTGPEKDMYIRNIANPRNKYMHSANRYPTGEAEVNNLVAEAHTLIARVANF